MRDRGGILVVKRRDIAESPAADGKGAYKRLRYKPLFLYGGMPKLTTNQ
jgi:hypothetical protein